MDWAGKVRVKRYSVEAHENATSCKLKPLAFLRCNHHPSTPTRWLNTSIREVPRGFYLPTYKRQPTLGKAALFWSYLEIPTWRAAVHAKYSQSYQAVWRGMTTPCISLPGQRF